MQSAARMFAHRGSGATDNARRSAGRRGAWWQVRTGAMPPACY